jgi:hypothetical protein
VTPGQREEVLKPDKNGDDHELAAGRQVWIRLALITIVALSLAALGTAFVAVGGRHSAARPTTRAIPVSVSCSDPRFCMAVDDLGRAFAFDGTTWSAPTGVSLNPMTSVSCPGPGFCTAVDSGGEAVTFNGHSWSKAVSIDSISAHELSAYGLNGLTDVSCPEPTFCMAVDSSAHSFVLTGTAWSKAKPVEPPTLAQLIGGIRQGGISGVSCSSASFCAAVTVLGGGVTFDGTSWSIKGKSWSQRHVIEPPKLVGQATDYGFPSIAGVACPTSSFCAAVSPIGKVSTFNGAAWSSPETVDPASISTGDGTGLTAVSCPSRAFCVAVDGSGDAVTFDGGTWSTPQLIDPMLGLTSVSCPSSNFCVALDDIGNAVIYDGHSWSTPRLIDR